MAGACPPGAVACLSQGNTPSRGTFDELRWRDANARRTSSLCTVETSDTGKDRTRRHEDHEGHEDYETTALSTSTSRRRRVIKNEPANTNNHDTEVACIYGFVFDDVGRIAANEVD